MILYYIILYYIYIILYYIYNYCIHITVGFSPTSGSFGVKMLDLLSAGAATPSCAGAGALDVQFLKGADAKDGDIDYK